MTPVPVFTLEEHHEAYFVWGYAVREKLMSASGNALLHVDEHHDLVTSRRSAANHLLDGDLADLHKTTYQELGIASFIVPAIYQGLFDEICWVHPRMPSSKDETMYLYSPDGNPEKLQLTSSLREAGLVNPTLRSFKLRSQAISTPFKSENAVILDIDLDYFSCDVGPGNCRIEVTQREFESFQSNKYHFLRLIPSKATRAWHEDGRWFLEISQTADEAPTTLKLSNEDALARVSAFIEFLRQSALNPALVVVCRSRFSGFTAEEQWPLLEQAVIDGLRSLWPVSVRHIREITPT